MKILFEDKDIIVCFKQAGELSEKKEGARRKSVKELYGSELFTVHRLDRETAGVMVYARNSSAAANLSAQIRDRKFEKVYYAVLRGTPEQPAAELTDYLIRDTKHNKTLTADSETDGAKYACLQYETVAESQGLSLVKVRLFTGRTHQIRVQFSSRGTPVYADSRYNGGRGELALCACRLSFTHPSNGKIMKFSVMPDTDIFPWNLFKSEVFQL